MSNINEEESDEKLLDTLKTVFKHNHFKSSLQKKAIKTIIKRKFYNTL